MLQFMSTYPAEPLGRNTVWLMAIACLVSIGSLYYNQPLLPLMSKTFQVSVVQVSAVPTLTQMGYALGMLLFIPLGDCTHRQRLIVLLSGLNAIALVLIAVAPTFGWLAWMSFVNGMTAVVPQLLVPFAAQLASPDQRGRIVGIVMGGLLGGIVFSRIAGGFAGEWLGWRSIFWIAAVLMVGLAVVLSRNLPILTSTIALSYGALMRSLLGLLAHYPLLRETSLTGGLFFSIYCGFWATLPFLLEQPPFELGSRVAGLFGLVGIVGTLAAPIVGKIADRNTPRLTVGIAMLFLTLALLILWQFRISIGGLLLGAILLDLGVQTGQISNQTRIYSLPANAHNRLTTVYMVSYFLGGSFGSWLSSYGWKVAGWTGVCVIGLTATGIALAVYIAHRKTH
ncbi:arabinose efflux permease family protein [Leptolyngbyaceae cyanobacterium JSC-12]|nr:arabinose efflux permease family protein [Leptolyngbyaceae cyanobacterium JSC-12]